ncbi:MAG: MxaK protein, partial [Gammaproteobacteria bacterium]
RGNIHLRDAQALAASDTGRIALVSLAKQDYRTALLINSSLWDARYNLELALLMVPEEPAENKVYTRRKGAESVVVKAVGFRVDLP